jgi:acetyl esterase
MPNPVYLEPQARAVADANANPPYLFELGPDQGRRTVDAVQSGPVKKLLVDIEDSAVPGGPSGQVSVRVVRPPGARRPLPVIDPAPAEPVGLAGLSVGCWAHSLR